MAIRIFIRFPPERDIKRNNKTEAKKTKTTVLQPHVKIPNRQHTENIKKERPGRNAGVFLMRRSAASRVRWHLRSYRGSPDL